MAGPDYLKVDVERHGPVCVLRAAGELDYFTAGEFNRQVAAVWQAPAKRIVVDLSGLRFADCVGVRALAAMKQAAPEDMPVIMRAMRPPVRRAAAMLGLHLEPPAQIMPSAREESPILAETRRAIEYSRSLARMVAATEENLARTFIQMAGRRHAAEAAHLTELSETATREAARLRQLARQL
jgi:anti-anti-sigma factor